MLRRHNAPTLCRRIAPQMFDEIRRYIVETWYIAARCAVRFPVGIAGRLVAVILWCDRPRRSLDFDSLRGAPPLRTQSSLPSAKCAPGAMRYVCVGAAISRPVVFPMGKQRRRIAPTMHHQTFANEIRRYNAETWCTCNIGTLIRPNWFCPKICNVGGRMISAPTRSVPPKFPLGHSVAPSA